MIANGVPRFQMKDSALMLSSDVVHGALAIRLQRTSFTTYSCTMPRSETDDDGRMNNSYSRHNATLRLATPCPRLQCPLMSATPALAFTYPTGNRTHVL